MTVQPVKEPAEKLEARVTHLEIELAQMKQLLSKVTEKEIPWWLKIAGSCEDDPTFDEAMHLGQQWRKSAE
ncbi:hypothetical protein [Roseofilum capinflatum]|uniref:Uncharacterized protein n=1 Tax=Roseofilum capinflatum BLCC-M114 TaxID=3022440 RepID=A0ABT7B9C9_9CYAN|nr:hypothetical protein [Roseofilum capinflatum]MDJ1175715.1 hypothetical protein [Roseofilum capinflatum BLCC-M114]